MNAREGTTCCVEADRTERHHGYPLEEPATRTILPSLIPRRRPVEAPAPPAKTPREHAVTDTRVIAQEDSEDLCVRTCRRVSRAPVDALRQLTPDAAPRHAPSQDSHHHCRYSCRLRWARVLVTVRSVKWSPVALPSHRSDALILLRDNAHTRKIPLAPSTADLGYVGA